MIKIKSLMLLLLAAATIMSCQKEVNSTDGTGSQQDEPLLTKITYSETGYTFIDSFEYDAQNRCKRYSENYHDSSAGPNPNPYVYFHDFHYNGNETLPYKITDTSQGRQMIWLIEYDAQKRKTVDSVVYPGSAEKQVTYYTYQTNRIVAATIYSSSGMAVSTTKDTFDYNGNNCTRHAVRIQQTGYDFWWQYSMTAYDTRINPVSKMNIANAVMFGANGTLGDYLGLNKNNYLSINYVNSSPGSEWSSTYQYTYDGDGYPLSANISTLNDPTRNLTVKYWYKK